MDMNRQRRPVGSVPGVTPDWDDPKFCVLYKNYLGAYRAFLSALRKRKEIRAWYVEHRANKIVRQPIGAHAKPATPKKAARRPVASIPAKDRNRMKVNMGDILGVVTLIAKSPAPPTNEDSSAKLSYENMFDETQLKMYFNAKRKYAEALRALISHQVKPLRQSAKNRAEYMANTQLLGSESTMGEEFENMKEEVRSIMEMVLGEYRANPGPETFSLLIESFVEGQLVGVEGSINDEINQEINDYGTHGGPRQQP